MPARHLLPAGHVRHALRLLRRCELGTKLLLQRLQFTEERIKLLIADLRLVVNIVELLVVAHNIAQSLCSGPSCVVGIAHCIANRNRF